MKNKPEWTTSANYWDQFEGGFYNSSLEVPTSVSKENIERITKSITEMPEGFVIHPKLKRVFDNRALMGAGERDVDWGMAEALSFGSLLDQGHPGSPNRSGLPPRNFQSPACSAARLSERL